MDTLLDEPRFDYVSTTDKAFVQAFDNEMTRLGYTHGGAIGDGFCWGRHMLIYRKQGVKSQTVYARVYLREADIVLRLFFNNIDKQRTHIEQATEHIKQVFTGPFGDCHHCHNEKDGQCRFRKTYSIDDVFIEKCNGNTFWFFKPMQEKLPDYINLFTAFYPPRKRN
jgi:hypothetical protein